MSARRHAAARRPGRQPQLRQDRAVQPADRQPAEGRQLRRRHRRAQGRPLPRAVRPQLRACSTCRAPTACTPPASTKRSRATCAAASIPGEPAPDVLVCVVDATNLRLHLRFALEVRELGRPMVLAVNMMDAAKRRGIDIDLAVLERELGVPVVPTIAVRRDGARALVAMLDRCRRHAARAAAAPAGGSPTTPTRCTPKRAACSSLAVTHAAPHRRDRRRARSLAAASGARPGGAGVVMFLIFQAVYAWATPLMDVIEAGTGALGELRRRDAARRARSTACSSTASSPASAA